MNKQERLELEYLRYFFEQAGEAFGPADADIYQWILESYDGELPEAYKPEVQG